LVGIRRKPEIFEKFLYYLFLEREVSIHLSHKNERKNRPAMAQATCRTVQDRAYKRADPRDNNLHLSRDSIIATPHAPVVLVHAVVVRALMGMLGR
jgi:hypothetical protein